MKRPLFHNRHTLKRHQGFTLVEMAVVVVIIGVIVGVAGKLLLEYQKRSDVDNAENIQQARDIEQAIRGFVYANSRLPCPDEVVAGSRDGVEDCTAAGGGKLAVGFLPHKTLQLYQAPGRAWANEIAYAAYRATTADTAELVQKYSNVSSDHASSCSGDETNTTVVSNCTVTDKADIPSAATLLYGDPTPSTALNMLDFCESLKTAASTAANAGLLHVTNPGTVNVAYAFALPSSPRLLVDGAGYLESRQGLTTPTEFQTSLTNSATNDDLTRIISLNRLHQAYNCPDRISGVQAVYHRDISLIANEYTHRIHLANSEIMLDIAEGGVGSAERDVIFGAIGIALATADLALSVAELSTLNAAAVAGIAVATLELANAIANLVLAEAALADAQDWLTQVTAHVVLFRAKLVVSGNQANQYRVVSRAAELRGGL